MMTTRSCYCAAALLALLAVLVATTTVPSAQPKAERPQAAASVAGTLPDPNLTPGLLALDKDHRPLTAAYVCETKWSLDVRHVSEKMKREVFRNYGIPWEARAAYLVDHLIGRENGGADDVRNLWPQRVKEAKTVKDRLENRLHKRVCVDRDLSLADSQALIANNWVDAYGLEFK